MKEKVDFVIRYEHKVRELESIMLIKLELERRGYTVAFVANYDYKSKKRYAPRVIVSPAIYNNNQLKMDITRYGLKNKIANLLWEQLMGIAEEESPIGPHNVYGTGQKVVTFCWGDNTKRRLVAVGMPEENAKVVGQINTDLLRGKFVETLATKAQLAEKYGLNVKARWNLFVSSFAYCELDSLQENLIRKVYGDKYFNEFTNISVQSREIILNWLEEALKRYSEDIIIYRPHPDEGGKSQRLKDLALKYPNFKVISELPMKHWCYASDKIYNWYSTGIIDAIVLKKPCRILRPCFISREYDYRLYYSANQIKSLQDFLNDYDSLEKNEGISSQMIDDYYYLPDRYIYKNVCDILEDILITDRYDIKYTKEEKKLYRTIYWKAEIKRTMSFLDPILRRLKLFKGRYMAEDARIKVLEEGFEKNVASEEEIKVLSEKLTPFVYGQEV